MLVHQRECELFNLCFNNSEVHFYWIFTQCRIKEMYQTKETEYSESRGWTTKKEAAIIVCILSNLKFLGNKELKETK